MMKNVLMRKSLELGAIRKGKFQLKCGCETDIYCDMRAAVLDPICLSFAVESLNTVLLDYSFDSIGVMEGAGSCVLMGALLQYVGDVRGFVVRKEPKEHGTAQMIEGTPGAKPILLDDVATSGSSLIHAIKNMPTLPVIALVLVDRQEGAVDALRPFGVELRSVLTLEEIRKFVTANK